MIKYGVVGAVALAVLVAAMWDGSKQPKKEVATEATVQGEVGSPPATPPPEVKPAIPEVPKAPPVIEEILEKYQVKKGDNLKSIAKNWLGDEKLAEALYEANKGRIPDVKHLSQRLTLVFPRSKFAKKVEEAPVDSATPGSVPAGMKKEEKPTEMPASAPVTSEKKYTVKEGDTLYGIAQRELGKGGRWREIQKLNNLGGETVKKGQVLVLPSK